VFGVFDFALIGLAAHRLWAIWLFSELVAPLRNKLVAKGGKIGYLASCQFCISVWAGLLATGLFMLGEIGYTLSAALAAGVAVFGYQNIMGYLDALIANKQLQNQEIQMKYRQG
jgi:hypothetical protein